MFVFGIIFIIIAAGMLVLAGMSLFQAAFMVRSYEKAVKDWENPPGSKVFLANQALFFALQALSQILLALQFIFDVPFMPVFIIGSLVASLWIAKNNTNKNSYERDMFKGMGIWFAVLTGVVAVVLIFVVVLAWLAN